MQKSQEAQFMKEISFHVCESSQNRGVKELSKWGNLKKGEVNFERGVRPSRTLWVRCTVSNIIQGLAGD